jgi:hypothetical protein
MVFPSLDLGENQEKRNALPANYRTKGVQAVLKFSVQHGIDPCVNKRKRDGRVYSRFN